jgi:hypothetical protein
MTERLISSALLPGGGCWLLLTTVIRFAFTRTTFCPVVSPSDELIYITDEPSAVFSSIKKTGCADKCMQYNGVCRCFNYNETSSHCSIFNFEPTNYAVDPFTTAYQVSMAKLLSNVRTSLTFSFLGT